jgi:hypothetical protein
MAARLLPGQATAAPEMMPHRAGTGWAGGQWGMPVASCMRGSGRVWAEGVGLAGAGEKDCAPALAQMPWALALLLAVRRMLCCATQPWRG